MHLQRIVGPVFAAALVVLGPLPAWAQDPALSAGDTAWVMASTALVLMMTLPGLAMFYAGLVRVRNVLSVIMHCFSVACVASLLWVICGYSLAFSDSIGGVIGGLDKVFFLGVSGAMVGSIPEIVFATFQMTFAVITPALIIGAYVERIKFSAILLFSGAWLLLVYVPVCHWIWGGGWLAQLGVMDFAGGLVVHATAGTSALVIATMLGPRNGHPDQVFPPHNPGMAAIGAGLLWVGWFGFNGGSQLAADGTAGMAIAVTHISAASAAVSWTVVEWIKFRKVSLVGAVTGVIGGLAAITPASGFVSPVGALIIGSISGVVCLYMTELVKHHWSIDDTLDVFAVHGAGGILGTLLLVGVAHLALGGSHYPAGVTMLEQFTAQMIGLAATVAWSVLVSYLIVKLVGVMLGGIRVDEKEEIVGVDLATHGERGYDF